MVRNTTESPVLLTHDRSGKLFGKLIDSIDVRRLTAKTAAFVAIGGAALTGAACSSHNTTEIAYESGKDKLNSMQENEGGSQSSGEYIEPSVEDPGVFDSHAVLPLDIYNTNVTDELYSRVLQETLPMLEAERAQSRAEIDAELASQRRIPLPDPENPVEGFTVEEKIIQQRQNEITTDLWTISKQENTILARNLLAAVFQPGTDAYEDVSEQIGNGKGKFLGPTYVDEIFANTTTGTVLSTEANGHRTYGAKLVSDSTGHIYKQVLQELQTNDSKRTVLIVVESDQLS